MSRQGQTGSIKCMYLSIKPPEKVFTHAHFCFLKLCTGIVPTVADFLSGNFSANLRTRPMTLTLEKYHHFWCDFQI